ncbi:PP2C family protein-serine/threonine phosphatase [Marihabitans asiaticum]|uniref:Stage II sporulation protein E n=1 Tax=Marihabitans asiaticum TaxID=415218 RepID=A0A560W7X9_9MICO|nr:PP2C family protein-serine/threonine phosphatase [Marihabitans asiaticum]TWD13734.1 stage II sporulation protein E [Marihabitans asiaticum]
MAVTSHPGRPLAPVVLDSVLRAVSSVSTGVHLSILGLYCAAFVVLHPLYPIAVPTAYFIPALLVAGFVLPFRALLQLCAAITVLMIGTVVLGPAQPYVVGPIAVAVTMGVVLLAGASRARHGVGAFVGDQMLVELRDRLFDTGAIPPLPEGWYAERAFASAYGEPFSGDFDVAVLQDDDSRLEIVLVDVAGQGQKVATRSLALSGALSGLVGQTDPGRVLAAANAYLGRAGWEDGFATAVHLDVDLASGRFSLGHAGHPPAVRFDAQAGRWVTVTAALGPALGLLPDPAYPRIEGVLRRGDALLVYTDGVVESPTADVADGIDWMLSRAEESMEHGLRGLTTQLVKQGRAGDGDDRGAILIRRD